MVKFASRKDGGYEKVSGHLQLPIEKAVTCYGCALERTEHDQKGYGINSNLM